MRKSSKKRPYRAVHLSRFEWDGICERVKRRRVVVGVDVAKEAMVAAVMDDEEIVVKTVRWSHPLETDQFIEFVERFGEDAIDVTVAMEPSGVYGDALRWQLHGAGFEVSRVSPKKSHDRSEIYDGVPSSHDGKSAAIVAVLHRRGASERWPQESERKRELTAALRLVEVFGKQFRQNRNRLEGLTARHWPELTLTLELGTATVLELLTAFGDPAAVAHELEEARADEERGRSDARLGEDRSRPDQPRLLERCPLTQEEARLVRSLAAEARRNQLELRRRNDASKTWRRRRRGRPRNSRRLWARRPRRFSWPTSETRASSSLLRLW